MYTDSNKHVEHAVMSTGYYIMIMIHFSTIVEVQLIKELPINIKLEVQQFLLHTMIFSCKDYTQVKSLHYKLIPMALEIITLLGFAYLVKSRCTLRSNSNSHLILIDPLHLPFAHTTSHHMYVHGYLLNRNQAIVTYKSQAPTPLSCVRPYLGEFWSKNQV